jgi:DNA-binding MarR family transcriptional regulator
MSTRSPLPKLSKSDAARFPLARKNNLRQLLLRASRVLNAQIVSALNGRGYDLRSTHTSLLSNLDDRGSTLSAVAARAGMSKQAMGRLADELEDLGYIKSGADPNDGRARVISYTAAGRKLMLSSFEVLAEIERGYGELIGQLALEGLKASLKRLLDALDLDSQALEE